MRLCGGRVPGNACQETQAFARALHLAIELGGAALRLQPAPPPARHTHAKRRHAGGEKHPGTQSKEQSSKNSKHNITRVVKQKPEYCNYHEQHIRFCELLQNQDKLRYLL